VIPEYKPVEDPGLVISLNILTQLEVLPEKLLRKKSKDIDEDFKNFRKEIQERHLRFLKRHPSILISDIVEVVFDSTGTRTEKNTLLAEIPEARIKEEWIWDFDLLHADYNRQKSQFKVFAGLF
jgi:hypothetical protein